MSCRRRTLFVRLVRQKHAGGIVSALTRTLPLFQTNAHHAPSPSPFVTKRGARTRFAPYLLTREVQSSDKKTRGAGKGKKHTRIAYKSNSIIHFLLLSLHVQPTRNYRPWCGVLRRPLGNEPG